MQKPSRSVEFFFVGASALVIFAVMTYQNPHLVAPMWMLVYGSMVWTFAFAVFCITNLIGHRVLARAVYVVLFAGIIYWCFVSS